MTVKMIVLIQRADVIWEEGYVGVHDTQYILCRNRCTGQSRPLLKLYRMVLCSLYSAVQTPPARR
jgi:hypothetical protein